MNIFDFEGSLTLRPFPDVWQEEAASRKGNRLKLTPQHLGDILIDLRTGFLFGQPSPFNVGVHDFSSHSGDFDIGEIIHTSTRFFESFKRVFLKQGGVL